MAQMNRWPSVWCSKYYFFSWFLAKFFSKFLSIYFLIFFYKITKMKIKNFECPKSIKSMKKIILGTSDSWSTIRLSHRPSNPAYYIEDCRISNVVTNLLLDFKKSYWLSWNLLLDGGCWLEHRAPLSFAGQMATL